MNFLKKLFIPKAKAGPPLEPGVAAVREVSQPSEGNSPSVASRPDAWERRQGKVGTWTLLKRLPGGKVLAVSPWGGKSIFNEREWELLPILPDLIRT